MGHEVNEFDINKFAAEYLDKNINKIFDFGLKILKGAKNSVKLKLRKSYKKYISNITSKYA
ncbi:MAG: hypothetical protein C4539_07380 [Ignavibacteriales bacterium]|nr:MAG: hypothetical protein C4539_07380 [Ignavibacteriales bacterium]